MRSARVSWAVRAFRISLLGSLALEACATGPEARSPGVTVPWARPAAATESARWVYAPAAADVMRGRVALPDGSQIYFGNAGQRWRVAADGSSEAAGELADDVLVAVTRTEAGAWLFVGQQGRIFEAKEPLGPIVRTSSPPEPMRRSSASGDRVLSVTAGGSLLRSLDGGRTFARVGDPVARYADVLFVSGDEALALTLPERLERSTDGGGTFLPVDRPAVGALGLLCTADGVAVVGYRGAEAVIGTSTTARTEDLAVPAPEGRMPPANGLGSLLAFDEGRIVAVSRFAGKRGTELARGPIGKRLSLERWESADDCQLSIAARSGYIYAVCEHHEKPGRATAFELRRWRQPSEEPEIVTGLIGNPAEARLVAGPHDTILIGGLCRRGAACTDAPLVLSGFRDVVPDLLPETTSSGGGSGRAIPPSAFVAAAAPQMQGKPLAMAFAASGAAFMVGLRAKMPNTLALFVSHDDGRTFAPRALPPELAGAAKKGVSGRLRAQISTDEAGIVSLALESPEGVAAATTDEDGRVLAWGAPEGSSAWTTLGISGRRMLAVDRTAAHESLDGGATWRLLDPVGTLTCGTGRCERPVACASEGCLVGQDIARLGWGGRSTRTRPPPAPRDDALAALGPPPSPIVCRLGKDKWLPFPPGEAALPTALQADRGKTAWAVLHTGPGGTASMVHGVPGAVPRLDVRPLLRALPRGAQAALAASSQLEGGVALRYRVTSDVEGMLNVGKPGRDIEVAWENLFEGKITHANLPGQLQLAADDAAPWTTDVLRAQPGLLTVSQGGMLVRVQSGRGAIQTIDLRGVIDTLEAKEAPPIEVDGEAVPFRIDGVRVGGKSLQVGLSPYGVLRLDPRPGGFSLGIPGDGPRADAVDLAYRGTEPFLLHVFRPPGNGSDAGTVHAFRHDGPALGPGIPIPTQRDLLTTFRPCTDADRSATHRIVARRGRPTVRGLVLEAPDGGFFAGAVSEEMVLYGTPAAPCASVLDARTVTDEDTGVPSDRALVMLSDLEHSWFFRRTERAPVEARTMRCRLAPKERLPKVVEDALTAERGLSN